MECDARGFAPKWFAPQTCCKSARSRLAQAELWAKKAGALRLASVLHDASRPFAPALHLAIGGVGGGQGTSVYHSRLAAERFPSLLAVSSLEPSVTVAAPRTCSARGLTGKQPSRFATRNHMTKSLLDFACRHLLLMRVAAALTPRVGRVRSVRHAAAAAQDSDRPDVGISFTVGGLLFPYQLGAAKALYEAGVASPATPLAGASSGAIVAVVAALSETGSPSLDESLEAAWRHTRSLQKTDGFVPVFDHLGIHLPTEVYLINLAAIPEELVVSTPT